ncbi:MAG: hypothetical protein RL328_1393 [Acidobacteriota bacterium]|jgi:hypothetical protein
MAFLSKSLSRRTVLKAAGASLSLPFLEAMLPPMRGATKPVHRFQAFYTPNGMAMEYWTPKTNGPKFEMPPILESMKPFQDKMLMFGGIKASWNYIHAGASGSFLTGTPRGGRNEIEIIADVSIDQMLGRKFEQETQLGSMQMSLDAPANAGACTGNLSCAYLCTLSWRSQTQPLPMDWNPRTVFEKMFGDTGTTDWAARAKRLRQQNSILDSVNEKISGLRRELGPSDQRKLEEYTESVRDVERRVQMAEAQKDVELPQLDQPLGAPPTFEEHLQLLLDLQILAYRADLTRVIAFMISKEQSPRPYPQIGVPEAHHPLSHHNNVPELIEKMSKINRYHADLFAKYVTRLSETKDGDRSLLDNITILYGAGLSNSNGHSGANLPQMLVGGGAGTWKGGRYLDFKDQPSQANLLLTIMDKFGVPLDKVGGSTGKLLLEPLGGV